MGRNPARRAALLNAAIDVLARDGARGLTFRAVDTQAGGAGGPPAPHLPPPRRPLRPAGGGPPPPPPPFAPPPPTPTST